MILQDKIRGSLVGGAIGDALGYPVEFVGSIQDIQKRYGLQGITRFDTHPYWLKEEEQTGKAIISDDTQMTLFTINGILNAIGKGTPLLDGIRNAYLEWLFTQTGEDVHKPHECWLTEVPELNHRRAPGNTCITSLAAIARNQLPRNNSKGCGGVMRIAPVPLYAVAKGMDIAESDLLAGEVAQLTHLHPLGVIPAALTAHLIYRLIEKEKPIGDDVVMALEEGTKLLNTIYAGKEDWNLYLNYQRKLINKALELAANNEEDAVNIDRLGGGWVAEETLAIAIYSVMRHFDNFERAIIASVNHGGDSDSTGAVTGNIIGTVFGYNAIPDYIRDDLELHEVILKMADDLYESGLNKHI